MEPQKPIDTGTYIYYIRYRKLLTIVCVLLLLFGLPINIYNAPAFDQGHKYEDIGFVFDTVLMCLVTPIWMLVNIRKAYKAYCNEEEWKKM